MLLTFLVCPCSSTTFPIAEFLLRKAFHRAGRLFFAMFTRSVSGKVFSFVQLIIWKKNQKIKFPVITTQSIQSKLSAIYINCTLEILVFTSFNYRVLFTAQSSRGSTTHFINNLLLQITTQCLSLVFPNYFKYNTAQKSLINK